MEESEDLVSRPAVLMTVLLAVLIAVSIVQGALNLLGVLKMLG